MENKSRTKRWKAEEKRDRVEATVEEEAAMDEEGEEDTVEEAEVEAEAMAVEEGEAVMEGGAETAAPRGAGGASERRGGRGPVRGVRREAVTGVQAGGTGAGSPA